MRGKAAVVARLSQIPPDDCAVSTITSYELFTGVEKCARPAQERTRVNSLLLTLHVLPFDAAAAHEAAQIRALLEAKGQSIGPYDVLIAGHAIAAQLTLVTANTSEFSRVSGLSLEDWSDSVSSN